MLGLRLLAGTAAVALLVGNAHAAVIGCDDFDGGGTYLTRTITPDNSANNGRFPGSVFDVFGITDRTANFDLADDSVSINPADTFGILKEDKLDKVFGVEDLNNPDNPSGTGTAVWTFDISGYSDLTMDIKFAAMGDFESSDSFTFTYSIDGGPAQNLFTSQTREDIDPYTYTLASGTMVNINDPVEVNGTVLDNNFQILSASVIGTGSVLTLTFNAVNDGGSEVFLFDDCKLNGVPEPATAAMLAFAGVFALRRRTA